MQLLLLAALCLAAAVHCQPSFPWDYVTDLDRYVHNDDGYFSWYEMEEYDGTDRDVTVYVVNMTSQKYQDESFVSRSVWWHIMAIAIPHDIKHPGSGFLLIEGGDNEGDILRESKTFNDWIVRLAGDTHTCAAYILQVPNQPVVFANDPSKMRRKEDSMIAWTWRTYSNALENDPTVLLRMPMTKAAKRGLDTLYEVAKEKAPHTDISRFTVSGVSKRGWTTWSLACTDRRVVAIAPQLFSMINITRTVMNHYRSMAGAYSFALAPYWRENLTREFFTPRDDGIWDVEDVYRYRDRLCGVFKLLIATTGDEFFLLDDTHHWWNGMPGPKWMSMLPNAGHSTVQHADDIYETTAAFWTSVLEDKPLPRMSWTMTELTSGGTIVLYADSQPGFVNVTAWIATTLSGDVRRDFRQHISDKGTIRPHPIIWTETLLDYIHASASGYRYEVTAESVNGSWVGFFIQGTWKGPAPHYYRLTLSTEVNVIPYTWPRGPCHKEQECYGYIV